MPISTLFKLDSASLTSEAEVETRFLPKLFKDLGYPDKAILPKKHIKALKINDGTKTTTKEIDFILTNEEGDARVIVEAKGPSISIISAWGQAASYALSYNRDKKEKERIKWLLLTNGYTTGLFPIDSEIPIVTLRLSDFASGMPPYVTLRTYIKYNAIRTVSELSLPFEALLPQKLNDLFSSSHNLVWKKEKLAPADAFFEFCKFIFIKIREDKKREKIDKDIETYKIPLTLEWLDAQKETSNHPVRDVLFKKLHDELEESIKKDNKKRIFEKAETLKLSAATCKELITYFQNVNLSSIDEDLNGRMFEVFLAASIRGKALGQYFTPRSVVDFMTRIALRNRDVIEPPKVLDACCGTAGFLIEVMAYLTAGLRDDSRFTETQKKNLRKKICNDSLYGIEANERVARIARINMYLHGDGGSHIFHGDGLDIDPEISADMSGEQKDGIKEIKQYIINNSFDIILTNPPFSMTYDINKDDEKRIILQHELTQEMTSSKSSILFLNRYFELLKPNGELLIVLDDTVINGKTFENIREWILEKFIVLGIHSLPFNAFYKAGAGVKTSILHLRKKINSNEIQGHIFMSVSNNIGHDNSLKDTPERNNLTDTLLAYLEWQRTGKIEVLNRKNNLINDNLECPQQYWLLPPKKLFAERFDAFFHCPDLQNIYDTLHRLSIQKEIAILSGNDIKRREKLSKNEKQKLIDKKAILKYIEISDVTQYGLITKFIEGTFNDLPTRGEYQIHKGDILFALNTSSRGTVVLVPDEYDKAICTSGFLVLVPKDEEEGLLLWYSLRSELCRKQIYYLAQTAVQPELKIETWEKYFKIPMPMGKERKQAINKVNEFYSHLKKLADINEYRFNILQC
jgi:type I restriction enzyme M protein